MRATEKIMSPSVDIKTKIDDLGLRESFAKLSSQVEQVRYTMFLIDHYEREEPAEQTLIAKLYGLLNSQLDSLSLDELLEVMPKEEAENIRANIANGDEPLKGLE